MRILRAEIRGEIVIFNIATVPVALIMGENRRDVIAPIVLHNGGSLRIKTRLLTKLFVIASNQNGLVFLLDRLIAARSDSSFPIAYQFDLIVSGI